MNENVDLKAAVAISQMGDNKPPIEATLALRVDDLVRTADEWIKRVDKIPDELTATAARDFIAQLIAEEKGIDREIPARIAQLQEPIKETLSLIASVQLFRKNAVVRLDLAKTKIKAKLKTWIDAERECQRKEAEDAAKAVRLAEQEAARAAFAASAEDAGVDDVVAAAKAQDALKDAQRAETKAANAKPQVASNVGARALGTRDYWSATVTDWAKAAAHYANHPGVREAIQKAADADARSFKGGLSVPGVEAKKEDRL